MTIGTAVAGLSRLDQLVLALEQLGARHVGDGVQDAHYDTVAAPLLDTLHKGLDEAFPDEVKEAWVVCGVLADTMKEAAARATP